MMSRLRFTVYGIPVSQGSMTSFRSNTTGRVITKHPPKLGSWRQTVAAAALEELGNDPMLDGAVAVTARFFVLRPKSISKKRTRPCVKPDIDKLVRACFDAMEGVVFRNDSQVCSVQASKVYGDPARVELEVIGE